MKIDIKKITKSKTIRIEGNETWMADFYEAFPDNKDAKLTGSITLTPDEYEHCSVKGDVSYMLNLECTRCTAPIAHEVNASFDMLFRPLSMDLNANEIDLSAEELNANYMNKNQEIDVTQTLIDFINDQVPNKLHCGKCSGKKIDGPIYKSENDEKLNPFAKLKDLKLPN